MKIFGAGIALSLTFFLAPIAHATDRVEIAQSKNLIIAQSNTGKYNACITKCIKAFESCKPGLIKEGQETRCQATYNSCQNGCDQYK